MHSNAYRLFLKVCFHSLSLLVLLIDIVLRCHSSQYASKRSKLVFTLTCFIVALRYVYASYKYDTEIKAAMNR